jgi:hypothetical protein
MKRFVVPTVAALALIAGTAVADQQHRTQAGQTQAGQTQAGQTQAGQVGAQPGQRAPEAGQHDLMAMEVVDSMGRKVGDIINVLVDEEGQVRAVIIQRGTALLGIGGEEVALPFDRLRLPDPGTPGTERRASIDMTEEQIAELPAYEGEPEIRDHERAPGMEPGVSPEAQPGSPHER